VIEPGDDAALFEVLEPPPGGLARLRARIEAHERSMRRTGLLFGAAGLAAALLLITVLLLAPPAHRALLHGAEGDLLAIRLGLAAAPEEPVTIPPALRGSYAASRVPTSDDRVTYYRIGSR
jgi:hypothetical protein